VDLQGKICNKLFQIIILPLEVFDLLAGGISDRIPGETPLVRRSNTSSGRITI